VKTDAPDRRDPRIPTPLNRRTALATALSAAATTAVGLPWLVSCAQWPSSEVPPPVPREFRAAWVATVTHIDWPSRPGLGTAAQRAEMLGLLDRAQAIGLNALVLQVRPSADAIYPSALEPWSEYLSGADGLGPDEAWDPLAEWVSQAHRRGMELHAWFNPYRARHRLARSAPSAGHIARTDPGVVKAYGDWLWMDPGEPRAAQRMLDVVSDVLTRYDIDGVHIDDYFYPYPVNDAAGNPLPFPDDPSWQRYVDGGGGLARNDWRRDNVDRLIEAMARMIRQLKPWVRFGISPFGLPRPDRRPAGITGFSQYDTLFANVEHWLDQGWLDYLAPQLYWPIRQTGQAFDVLLATWRAGNAHGRHLWPGLYTSRIGAERNAYDSAEVLAQVAHTRLADQADNGHLHFSLVALTANREGIADQLRAGPYAQPALTPATPWLAEADPEPPALARQRLADGRWALWPRATAGAPLRQAVLWQRLAGSWQWQALPLPVERPFVLADATAPAWLVGIGRSGLESRALSVAPMAPDSAAAQA
jgi:uncharacterized lipoprotein YddW (UPF0748 family)